MLLSDITESPTSSIGQESVDDGRWQIPFLAISACLSNGDTYNGSPRWWKEIDDKFRKNPIVQPMDPTVQQIVEQFCAHCKRWTDFKAASRLYAWDAACYQERLRALIIMGLSDEFTFGEISHILKKIDSNPSIPQVDVQMIEHVYLTMERGEARNGTQPLYNKIRDSFETTDKTRELREYKLLLNDFDESPEPSEEDTGRLVLSL